MQGKWGMLTYCSYSMHIKEESHNIIVNLHIQIRLKFNLISLVAQHQAFRNSCIKLIK